MKILYLSRESEMMRYNYWYGFDAFMNFNKVADLEVKFYGIGINQFYPNYSVLDYNQKILFSDLKKEFDFDVIILANKNRMFLPKIKNEPREGWIPKDLSSRKELKLIVEGDFHQYCSDTWFHDFKINGILHRHKGNVYRGKRKIPKYTHHWLPCSVNSDVFKPNDRVRENKACFIGNYNGSGCYPARTKAIARLNQYPNFINEGCRTGDEYIKILQKYKIYLNCSSKYYIDNAKAFEIISSGGILLTDRTDLNGFPELFGKENYLTYNPNCSDLIPILENFLNCPLKYRNMVERGRNIILNKHSHDKRGEDLVRIINTL